MCLCAECPVAMEHFIKLNQKNYSLCCDTMCIVCGVMCSMNTVQSVTLNKSPRVHFYVKAFVKVGNHVRLLCKFCKNLIFV